MTNYLQLQVEITAEAEVTPAKAEPELGAEKEQTS